MKFVRRSSWIPDVVKACCAGSGAAQWSTNNADPSGASHHPHSSSNNNNNNSSSLPVWRWLDVRAFRRPGQKNHHIINGTATPLEGGNSVGNSASLNRPILARENASLNSIVDNGGFDSLPPYERDMRQLSCVGKLLLFFLLMLSYSTRSCLTSATCASSAASVSCCSFC